jgi:predicted amidohydrolase
MQVAIIQADLHWELKQDNLQMFDSIIGKVELNTELILLPEMFTTGFTMCPDLFAEPLNGNTATWMLQHAAYRKALIAGSFITLENSQYFNTMVVAFPNGNLTHYHKRHLFSYGNEQLHYTAGTQRQLLSYNDWQISPFVCYDIRFPVWIRRTKQFNYDILLVSANWPDRRAYHWKQLLIARAIENQCYVLASNRVGNDGNGIYHSGFSCIINPMGEVVQSLEHETGIIYQQFVKTEVINWRTQFKAIDDADDFEIKT